MQVNQIFFIGSNKYGQSGTGQKNNAKSIQILKPYHFAIFIKQVSCGYHHSAILTISGYVYTMGSNIHGTLGTRQSTLNYSFSPILVEQLPIINKIQSGAFHLCALSQDGIIYSWGRGMDGQLGNGSNRNAYLPQKIQLDEQIIDLSCGTNHTILLGQSKKAYAFGNGIYGQLGTGNNKNQLKPKLISNLAEVTMVAAGQNHSLYLCRDTIYATGDNTCGQIGIGNTKKYVLQPQKINLDQVSIVRAAKFSCALAAGNLYVWGGSTKKYFPVKINCSVSFTQVKCGNDLVMVLSSNGQLFNWKVSQLLNQDDVLEKVEINTPTVLDFSIGQNHLMILGDIINTVQQKQSQQIPRILKHYERQQFVKIEKRQENYFEKSKKQMDSTGFRQNLQASQISYNGNVDKEKINNKNKSNSNNQNRSKKSINNQNNILTPTKVNSVNPSLKIDFQNKMDELIKQNKNCINRLQQVKSLIFQSNNIKIDSQKNKSVFSRKSQKIQSYSSQFSKKSQIAQINKSSLLTIREKDLKISQLQQQLSKKNVMIDAYQNTLYTLQKMIENQRGQIEIFDRCLRQQKYPLNQQTIKNSYDNLY